MKFVEEKNPPFRRLIEETVSLRSNNKKKKKKIISFRMLYIHTYVSRVMFPRNLKGRKKGKKNVCTNRAGGAVKTRRSACGGRGDSWHKKRISLMGNGHLGAQGDLVDRAGDTMPMVPRYTQHP